MGRKILRRIKKDISKKVGKKEIIFFLDYDGTLTPIRKKPHLAKINTSTKKLLKKLTKLTRKVYIISGRSLGDVKSLVGVNGVSYIGNHGLEVTGGKTHPIQKKAKKLKPFIQKAKRILRKTINFKGVFVEDKGYTLSVHYRLLDKKNIEAFKKIFDSSTKKLIKSKKIKVTKGKKVFEVRPNLRWDKGKAVLWVIKKQKKVLPICIGDDITDEDAFRAIGKKGISILVSKKKKKTFAQHRIESSQDVINLLKWCINE